MVTNKPNISWYENIKDQKMWTTNVSEPYFDMKMKKTKNMYKL